MAGEKIKSFLREKVPGFEKILGPAEKAELSISEELLEPWQRELVERQYGIKLDESSTWGGAIEELTKPVPTKNKGVYKLRIIPEEVREALSENIEVLSPESREAFGKNPKKFVDSLFFHDLEKGLGWDIKKVLAASPAIAAALFWIAPGAYDYLKHNVKSEQAYSEEKVERREMTPYEKLIHEVKREKDSGKLIKLVEKYQGNFPDLKVMHHVVMGHIFTSWDQNFSPDFNFLEKVLSRVDAPPGARSLLAEQDDSYRLIGDLNQLAQKLKDKKDFIAGARSLQKKILDRIPIISSASFAYLYSKDSMPKNLRDEMYQKMTPQVRVAADILANVYKQKYYEGGKNIDYQPVIKRLKSAKEEGILLDADAVGVISRYLPREERGVPTGIRRELLKSLVGIADPSLTMKLAGLFLGDSRGLEDIQTELIEKSIKAGWRIDRTMDAISFLEKIGPNESLQKKIIEVTGKDNERTPSFITLGDIKDFMHPNLFHAFIKEKLNPAWQLLVEFEKAEDEDSKIVALKKIKEWSEVKIDGWGDKTSSYFWGDSSHYLFNNARKMPRLQETILSFLSSDSLLRLARDETYSLDREEDDGRYDEVRQRAKTYIAPFLYAMIAQGQELNNTSVFEVLYNELKVKLPQYGGLEKFLAVTDSEGALASRFILTLSFFGKLGELVTDEKSAEHWGKTIIEFFSGKEISANSVFLTPTLENIFSGSSPKLKDYLEKKFLELARKSPSGSGEKQLFELILAQYGDKFSQERKEEAFKFSARARESFEKYFAIPVKDWIDEKGVLQSHMFFHPDHAYHFARLLEAAESEGYKVINRIVKDKKDAEITLERQSKGYPAKTLRIVATMSGDPKVAETLKDGKIPIVGHRGHSYQLDRTFYEKADLKKPTLFFFGSCGGFRAIPEIAKKYGSNAVFLATLGIGRGETNTQLLLYLQRSIGEQGITRWDKLSEGMNASLKKDAKEYIFPHQLPILQLFEKK